MKKRVLLLSAAFVSCVLLIGGCSAGGAGGGPDDPGIEAGDDAGNGTGEEQGSGRLTGPTADIVQKILDEAGKSLSGDEALPQTFVDPVTAENAPGMLGLTPDDFVSFVPEATSATGALNTQAFQVSVVRCNDAHDAEMIEGMIRSGFDSGKWICVFPEKSLTMISETYILLAVGGAKAADALAEAFKSEAGGIVKGPNVFYSGETGGEAGPGMSVDVENAG